MSEDSLPQRLHYHNAEATQPWLAALLDAYHEIDRGVHEAVRREERQGRRLACSRGCAACCRSHQDIPVYPLELMGLYFYGVKTKRERRETLAQGRVHALVQPLRCVDWSRLAARMEGPGRAGSGAGSGVEADLGAGSAVEGRSST